MQSQQGEAGLEARLRWPSARPGDGLRALAFYGWAGLTGAVVAAALVASAPLPHRLRYRIGTVWTRINLAFLRRVCGLDWEVQGREHIPAGPAVVLCKHQSAWETMALQTIFPRQVWVLKRELLWVPLIGWGLATLDPIAIDRRAGYRALKEIARQGAERLAAGAWVVVFPEGTRTAPGSSHTYHAGGGLLAVEAGVPVVPVAHNAGLFWPRNGFAKRAGRITVRVGPPIDSAGRKPAQVTRAAEQWIEPASRELLEPYLESPPAGGA